MRRFFAALLMSVPLAVFGATGKVDHSFFTQAAQGSLAEVDNGKLAKAQGQSQEVKDFAEMMVKDHSAANDKLQAIAESESITLPSAPSRRQASAHQKLRLLSYASFDRSYMKNQIKSHEKTVALFKREIAKGKDGPAKTFASETLPEVQSHLAKARSIYAELGH
jgi:putative membrane protein